MRTTIGEIVNEIIPFCSKIEMKLFQDVPFVSASLKNARNLTIGRMYIVQTKENQYSFYSSDKDTFGTHYFPTGSIFNPLISDSEVVPSLFKEKDLPKKVIENVNLTEFLYYFYIILYNYEITRFNPKHLTKKFSELGFRSKNIIKNIDKTFTLRGYENGTIKDLLEIVKNEECFILGPLKSKETHIIELKLKDLGLLASIKNNRIYSIKLDSFYRIQEQKLETEYV